MAEVPEHLLKRSRERRKALGLPVEGDDGDGRSRARGRRARGRRRRGRRGRAGRRRRRRDAGEAITEDKGGIPAHLLERSRKRKAALAGGGGGDAAPAAAGGARTARRDRGRRTRADQQRVRAVTPSDCSPSSSRVRSSRRAPRPRTRCTSGRTCS